MEVWVRSTTTGWDQSPKWDRIIIIAQMGYKFQVQKLNIFDFETFDINPHKCVSNATTFGLEVFLYVSSL